MGITCVEVWRDISDYIDDELAPEQRAELDEHFAECRHCTAILEGTCNVIRLTAMNESWLPSGAFTIDLKDESTKN